MTRPGEPHGRGQALRRNPWQAFVHRHGWRAYALPILTVVTIIELTRLGPGAAAAPTVRHTAANLRSAAPTNSAAASPTHTVTAPPATTSAVTTRASPTNGAHPSPTTNAASSAAQTGTARPCAANATAQLIVVSIQQQHAWICAATAQVYSTAVTTGATDVSDATPIGTWRVQDKQTDRYLVGPGYRDHVKYWVPFNGDFGFHDASWQTMAFGSPLYHALGSHGCVHLPTAAMSWLYHWVRVGATVTVQT